MKNKLCKKIDEYEYDKFPVKFTDSYLRNNESSSYRGIDYDDEINSDKDLEKKIY